jgi:hypothetical protein
MVTNIIVANVFALIQINAIEPSFKDLWQAV